MIKSFDKLFIKRLHDHVIDEKKIMTPYPRSLQNTSAIPNMHEAHM